MPFPSNHLHAYIPCIYPILGHNYLPYFALGSQCSLAHTRRSLGPKSSVRGASATSLSSFANQRLCSLMLLEAPRANIRRFPMCTSAVDFGLWSYQPCLGCDTLLQPDGAAYCSEGCKKIDFEKSTLPPNVQASSSEFSLPSSLLATLPPERLPSAGARISPPHVSRTAQSCGTQQMPGLRDMMAASHYAGPHSTALPSTPANSHGSLCWMHNNTKSHHLSRQTRVELQAYAVCLEQMRMQRRSR